jgi:aldose 1-epimerase
MAKRVFGECPHGTIHLYTLTDQDSGARVVLSEYGAAIISVEVKGKDGLVDHVVAGYDDVGAYLPGGPGYLWHMGHVVGRCANRIASSGMSIDGKHYTLENNNQPNGRPCHLHGGSQGFGKRLWAAEDVSDSSVTFVLVSPDGDAGYPGEVTLRVTYRLKSYEDDKSPGSTVVELSMEYAGTTTAKTVLNPTNHAYWNLTGPRRFKKSHGSGEDATALPTIENHTLHTPNVSSITATDEGLIPTGELLPVAGSVFDFVKPRRLGDALNTKDLSGQDPKAAQQFQWGGGIDHNFVVDGKPNDFRLAAALADPTSSGLAMEVWTTLPAVQVYTGNNLKVMEAFPKGFEGLSFPWRSAVCLETQFNPNAVNIPTFEQPITTPEKPFESCTIHLFRVMPEKSGSGEKQE